VILSILSQNGAFGEPCDWKEHGHNEVRIDIHGCESSKIDPVFLGNESEEFHRLIDLWIHAKLTAIEERQFTRATNLQTLDLSTNKIERVDKNAFIGLKKLTKLKLNDNKIRNLPMGVFAELPLLNELQLYSNRLTSFDFSIVKQNPQLNELNIGRNAITNITTSQQYSSNLTVIGMQMNSLTSLPIEHLPDFPNLHTLSIHSNKLTEFDFVSVKDKLPKLVEFYIGYNQFDCCFLVVIVRAMLLQMPKLKIDSEIIKHMNDTQALQDQNYCAKCETPTQ
jgi:Leucine rich repeat